MEGHETMTIDQAILAVVHRVGTVIAREITAITTVCTGRYLQPFSSIVAEHFLKVSIPICEPVFYDHASGALSLFGFPFSIGFVVLAVLHISLIYNIFRKRVVRFGVF
jgi:hypothetical protein